MEEKFFVPSEYVKGFNEAGLKIDKPAYHEVIDWLLTEKKVYISCNIESEVVFDDNKKFSHFNRFYYCDVYFPYENFTESRFKTREEALNSAFEHCLELLKGNLKNNEGSPSTVEDNKIYVPSKFIKRLKDAGFQIGKPTYHELLDWLENKKNTYVDTSLRFKRDAKTKKVVGVFHCLLHCPEKLYYLNEYPTREKALDSMIKRFLEYNDGKI